MERFWRRLAASLLAAVIAACGSADLKQAPTNGGASSGAPPIEEEGAPDSGVVVDGGRDPTPDGGTLPVSSNVTIQVQPSDNGAALLNLIKGAQSSVHMTMYLLTDDDVIDALGDLKQAGKDVKVVLNQSFPPNGGDNQPAYSALQARNVPVRWAPSAYTFTHAKTIIVDQSKVVIMTMNLTYSSAATNREYIAIDSDPQDVKDAETIFAADYDNLSLFVDTKLVVSPRGATNMEPRARLKAFIDSATTSLDVESQSLSDDTIVSAIVLAHQAGVAVRVVIDGDTNNTPAQAAAVAKLKQAGVPLRAVGSPDIHAKAIVVDDKQAFVGSMNLTPTALTQNREIGLVTDAKAEAAKVRQTIGADFAKGFVP